MNNLESIAVSLKRKLSVVQDREVYCDSDSLSEDRDDEYMKKQNKEIMSKVRELLYDDDEEQPLAEQSFQILTDDMKQEIQEELEDDYLADYQAARNAQSGNQYVSLIPKNELQLAYIYTDDYAMLWFRKRIHITLKQISALAGMIITHKLFETITLIVIIFNSAMLAMDDPTTEVQSSFQDLMDQVFLVCYTIEAVLKILAMGFVFNQGSYLRDTWNILDFTVILTAYLPYFLTSNSVNLNALRSFRVLRPLRTVSSVKALKAILVALFKSLGQLKDAIIILIFFYTIFAIAGVQLFSGYLKRRCFSNAEGIILLSDTTPFCIDDQECPSEYTCGKMMKNPGNGLINFDTFPYALMQVFIVTTLEGWTTIQTAVQLTFSYYAVLYFLIVVMIGAYFLVNLTLAIIKFNFKQDAKMEEVELEVFDYWQLRKLGLYEVSRDVVDCKGYGVTPTKEYESLNMPVRINMRRNTHLQTHKGPGATPMTSKRNRVQFQPIKLAVHFSQPIRINKNQKIQGIYGMGQNINNVALPTNPRNAVQRQRTISSQNDNQASVKRIDTYINDIDTIIKMPRQSRQSVLGAISDDPSQLSPSIDDQQQQKKSDKSDSKPILQHRGSIESSKSNGSRQPFIISGATHLQVPKIKDIRQQSFNVKPNLRVVDKVREKENTMVGGARPPRSSPKGEQDDSFDQDEFDSVNLSELNTISDEELDMRLREMDIQIEDNVQVSRIHSKRTTQREQNKLRRMENRKLKDPAKLADMEMQLDADPMKLKTRLFMTKFHPYLQAQEQFVSEDDVLVSKLMQMMEHREREQQRKIREMPIQLTYHFNNNKASISGRKSMMNKSSKTNFDNKSMSSSANRPSGRTLVKHSKTLSRHKVKPVNDDDMDDELEQQDLPQFQQPEQVVEEPEEAKEEEEGIDSHRQSRKIIKPKKKEEPLTYELCVQLFKDNPADTVVDLQKATLVEHIEEDKNKVSKDFLMSPIEQDIQSGLFYQEYAALKKQDVEHSHGNLVAQASIEDIIQISEYQYYDDGFVTQMNKILSALNYNEDQYYIWISGVIGFLLVVQRLILNFTKSSSFNFSMNLAVGINTIILALDGLVPDSSTDTLNSFNFAFTIIFTIELGVKLIGMGPVNYMRDTMNVFDALIVALSLVELFILGGGTSGKSSLSAFRSVRIFRAFRVLRVTKLMRGLKFMTFLISVLSQSFQSFMYIMLLLLIFIFIFTLLGMAFFGAQLSKTPSRQSYDDIQSAFLVVFQVLTLENWNSILYDLLLQDVGEYITIPYLVSWIALGNYVFLNLFLAILLENFERIYIEEKMELEQEMIIGKDTVMDATDTLKKSKKSTLTLQFETAEKKTKNPEFVYFSENGMCELSLNLFSQINPIRRICYRTVKDNRFETIIFIMIFLTSVKLVYDTYIPDTGTLKDISLNVDYFFAVFFAVEMCMKIIAFGFFQEDFSYLRESWNILDFFIVIASLIDVSVTTINIGFVKILRLLRTLRPLRFITHNRSMKILVSALLQSINGIVNVAIVVILSWMMFAILGVNLQKGKLHYCKLGDESNFYHSAECTANGGVWSNHDTNFDNILWGMLTLFILSTLEGWPDIMYFFVDADEDGPIKGAQLQFSWFFVIFILVGSILLMNLFIGVILVNYHLAEEGARDACLTQAQMDWMDIQSLVAHSKPNMAQFFVPDNPFRAKVFKLIKHPIFDGVIMFFIVFNIIVLALAKEDADAIYNTVLDNLNLTFTAIFISEAILKLTALGPIGYFRNGWNQFDFFVVMASILDLILQISGNSFISFLAVGPQLARVFRVLRVTRLFRLIKSFEGLQKLIETAIFSLPAMLNVSALLFLVFFIFSILGVFLFGTITSGDAIDEVNNFKDFHHAFQLLFRCASGEDWFKIMFDTMRGDQTYNCIFFLIFILIQQYIMLNLFILIILDQYERNYLQEENPLNKFQEHENTFLSAWADLPTEDRGMKMHQKQLVQLMLRMEYPLGYDLKTIIKEEVSTWSRVNPTINNKTNIDKLQQTITARAKKFVSTQIMKMNIYSDQFGYVQYHQIFFAFMKSYLFDKISKDLQPEGAEKIRIKEEDTMKKIKKKQFGISYKEQEPVNPIVQFLFVLMSFKALKRYGYKKRIQREQMTAEKAEQEHYSDGNSSDSSFEKNVDIKSRRSNDDAEHPPRPEYGKPRYCAIPNTEVYKDDVYTCNLDSPQPDDSELSSSSADDAAKVVPQKSPSNHNSQKPPTPRRQQLSSNREIRTKSTKQTSQFKSHNTSSQKDVMLHDPSPSARKLGNDTPIILSSNQDI